MSNVNAEFSRAAMLGQGLRAKHGDLIFVPSRVKHVGSDGRSIRLCVEHGIPSIRITPTQTTCGLVNPELVYNPFQTLPTLIMERMATSAPLDSVSAEFQTLGHSQQQADLLAMSTPWIRDHLCFTSTTDLQQISSALVSASAASMRLTLAHPTRSAFEASKRPSDSEILSKLLSEFSDMTRSDKDMWHNDLPPSKWPASMIASGLVPTDDNLFP